MNMAPKPFTYLLGDSQREAERLDRQARLWDPVSEAMFNRIGIKRGWHVLEVGPGHGSLHKSLRKRVAGPVDAVEQSSVFADGIEAIAKADRHGAGKIWRCPLISADLPLERYDLIFLRWVFLFLPDPQKHVRKLVAALRPGGVLAVQDYHRDTFDMVPRPADWNAFREADRAFFASQGSDVSIGSKLPKMFARAGLSVGPVHPTLQVGGPQSDVWKWMSDYFLGVLPRLAEIRPFDLVQAKRLRQQWLRNAQKPGSLLVAPLLLDVVGRRS
jgi:SAM-dependent methyltransferase